MEILKDPPILFFILGILSVLVRSGLQIPAGLSKFLSLYLLMAIGFKGGLSLAKTGFTNEFLVCLVGGLLLSLVAPAVLFYSLKQKLGASNAAAIGATYGSVSAVTFVAATTWLENRGFEFSGSMIAILAIMEAPAIIVSLFLAKSHESDKNKTSSFSLSGLLHEALFNGSVFLLLGSVLIGYLSGPFGKESVGSFVIDLFKGLLGFFLLDLGIRSGKAILKMEIPIWLVVVAILTPLTSASLALMWGYVLSVSPAQTFLLMTLAAGASYIAVPAALKTALPAANPGMYLTMALGMTFPFNILLGLPLYWWAVQTLFN